MGQTLCSPGALECDGKPDCLQVSQQPAAIQTEANLPNSKTLAAPEHLQAAEIADEGSAGNTDGTHYVAEHWHAGAEQAPQQTPASTEVAPTEVLGKSNRTDFLIKMQLREGEKLGVCLSAGWDSSRNMGTLRVLSVESGGALDRWNRTHAPLQQVVKDAIIMDVCGHSPSAMDPKDAAVLFKTLPRDLSLVVRPPQAEEDC
mmetsp:Transcript_42576/g.97644  ORF Transcript_42576/g.97644 Transcript_42576/m.97644 type:complete len:202 (-) Transcript_42576:137-742(-)